MIQTINEKLKIRREEVPDMKKWWYFKEVLPGLFNLLLLINSKERDRKATCVSRWYYTYAFEGEKKNE